MRYRIFSCQNPKAHRKGKTHRPRDSIDSTCEIKSTIRSEDIGKKEDGSSNGQAQVLLTALHNLIVPLVQNVVPDASELTAGPEAELLLAALQNYIASIVGGRGQSGRVMWASTRTVHLEDLDTPDVRDTLGTKKISERIKDEMEPNELVDNSLISPLNLNCDRNGELIEILEGLRERVFNDLPIRLLRFDKPDGTTDLKISLLTRADIYSTLAKTIASKYIAMVPGNPACWYLVRRATKYAILSHTWLRSKPGDLTYEDWNNGSCDVAHPGYRKLVRFCKAAAENHKVTFGWMDTVCIDKSSSSELDESIRSMYKWYEGSSVCITYLAETTSVEDMQTDTWFTRGWTLQELLAPEILKFYDRNWVQLTTSLNDKHDIVIRKKIQLATSINEKELSADSLEFFPISRKMEWAAKRQVTRSEDVAYSLMGIFDISMTIAYGEGGTNAFARLVREIISTTKYRVLDIFNWGGGYHTKFSFLLPSNPEVYLNRDDTLDCLPSMPIKPLTLTHLGLCVPVLLLPYTLTDIQVAEYTPKGDFFASVSADYGEGVVLPLALTKKTSLILDAMAFDPTISKDCRRYALTVINCTASDEHSINIPVDCFAFSISYFSTGTQMTPLTLKQKTESTHPITFKIRHKYETPTLDDISDKPVYSVKRKELEHHGMQYLDMYF
ncbi:hypothetical protein BDN70DRAFT_885840 [Pholiota conissans]|uniref:Heterokaryon incompatibility domain-containing protein n=1 Tax=Pholiota conissans TaxID=109636 RepID=A0A9P5YTD5_9AGAR|nr:hypothetical protein BDN70DRAFT_885840 [Pholiota conissans]